MNDKERMVRLKEIRTAIDKIQYSRGPASDTEILWMKSFLYNAADASCGEGPPKDVLVDLAKEFRGHVIKTNKAVIDDDRIPGVIKSKFCNDLPETLKIHDGITEGIEKGDVESIARFTAIFQKSLSYDLIDQDFLVKFMNVVYNGLVDSLGEE